MTKKIMKVLIVDDESDVQFILKAFVSKYKKGEFEYDIHLASNGKEAFEKYMRLAEKRAKLDLVIMDLLMPVMDGVSSIQRIVEFDPSANICVVTASTDDGMLDDAMKSGAKALARKPIKKQELYESIEKTLGDKSEKQFSRRV